MHEILAQLRTGQHVLDLGSGAGSFDATGGPYVAIRADLDRPARLAPNFAQADAAHLPFADATFDAVVSNHSLEHFDDLAGALAEIGRILKPDGALYIGVPDASTFCDRLYRWLARGGGHVNPFTSAPDLAARIEDATRLPHVATRTSFASLSYLNRKNAPSGPRRRLLVGGGTELSLRPSGPTFASAAAARPVPLGFASGARSAGDLASAPIAAQAAELRTCFPKTATTRVRIM